MENYLPYDLTEKAKQISTIYPVSISAHTTYGTIPSRIPQIPAFHRLGKAPIARDTRAIITMNTPDIDIDQIGQLVETGQTRTAAQALRYISRGMENGVQVGGAIKKDLTMREWKVVLEEVMDRDGLDALHTERFLMGDMVAIRGIELMAIVNRIRGLKAEVARKAL